MRCLRPALLLLVSATAGGCFTLQNHYSVVDSSGLGATASEASAWLSIWLLFAVAVAGLALGSGLIWALLKWRDRSQPIALPEASLASEASRYEIGNESQASAGAVADLRPT